MNARDNAKEKQVQVDLETRILNKVLAKLYLDLMPSSHPGDMRVLAEETLNTIDGYFGIKRPSALEMHCSVEEVIKLDRDLGSRMRARILEEVTVFSQSKFGHFRTGRFSSEMTSRIEELLNAILVDEKVKLSGKERQRLFEYIIAEIMGLGPLEPLLADDAITDIMVDGYDKIYVDRRGGKLEDAPYHFRDDEHLMAAIYRIFAPLGRRLDESSPIVDARLPDGSLVNVVIPPISLIGPILTIRIFRPWLGRFTVEDLIHYGSASEEMFEFLEACVRGRLNVVIAGGAGAGKTALLRVIAGMIPDDERIITIEEDTALHTLSETKRHVITLEDRPANREGEGEITIRDLFINALRMRPDRIVVSEVRGPEVVDLLQAMNTGHDGTMSTIYAGSPRDALTRLEMMATSANPAVPLLNVRHKIASTVDLIIYGERLRDGSRKILKVTEVTGMQGDVVGLQDIFEFRETGIDGEGKITGYFTATGHIPRFLDRFQAAGIEVPLSLFTPR